MFSLDLSHNPKTIPTYVELCEAEIGGGVETGEGLYEV